MKAKSFGAALKERLRKTIVSLKVKPQTIPLIAFLVAFVIFTFEFSNISLTTERFGQKNMGLTTFIVFLLSILSFVCFLNSFPRRKKPNFLMLGIFTVMFGIILFCDITYYTTVVNEIAKIDPATFTGETLQRMLQSIYKTRDVMYTHIIIEIVGGVLLLTMPLYAKLIRKIDTSIEVDENENLKQIELAD